MKLLIITLVFVLLSCKSNLQNEMILHLTNNNAKFWYIDYGSKNIDIKRRTLWYFSSEGDHFWYYFDVKTKKIELQNHGDYFPIGKFSVLNKDTILLDGRKFPIIELTKDKLILKDIYSFSYFDDGYIYLRSCSDDNDLFNLSCVQILEYMEILKQEYKLEFEKTAL
jgi:hypothetical protein